MNAGVFLRGTFMTAKAIAQFVEEMDDGGLTSREVPDTGKEAWNRRLRDSALMPRCTHAPTLMFLAFASHSLLSNCQQTPHTLSASELAPMPRSYTSTPGCKQEAAKVELHWGIMPVKVSRHRCPLPPQNAALKVSTCTSHAHMLSLETGDWSIVSATCAWHPGCQPRHRGR